MLLHFKLATLFFGIALANVCCAEKVSEIVLEAEPDQGPGKKIVIRLLSPLDVHGNHLGGGRSTEFMDIGIEGVSAGDHGFLYTSEGELFIDNMYAGKFDASDTLQYGYNRLWANGAPCFLSKVSKRQAKIIYDETPSGGVQSDGSSLICKVPYRIFLKPVTGDGGGSNGNGVLTIKDGMHVLRVEGGVLHVNGISYGDVKLGAEIRIIDDRVFVNGAVCLPQADRDQEVIEQGGAEPKSEGKVKP